MLSKYLTLIKDTHVISFFSFTIYRDQREEFKVKLEMGDDLTEIYVHT